jgi:hypothetical protein
MNKRIRANQKTLKVEIQNNWQVMVRKGINWFPYNYDQKMNYKEAISLFNSIRGGFKNDIRLVYIADSN